MPRNVLIKIRRGTEAQLPTLDVGELGFCTDTNKLYIGTPTGNQLLVAAQSVGDMLKSIYDTDYDGKVDAAETADSVPWTGVTGKPSTFTPAAHTHTTSQITDFPTSMPANGGNADTVDGKHSSDFTLQFALPSPGSVTKYHKIAELTTAIGAGENGGIFYVNGLGDFGSNKMGLDIIQFSTRGSSYLRVLRLLKYGQGTVRYGYVVNSSTGNTEIWIQLATYNYGINIFVGNNRALTACGNLLSQATEPTNVVWVTPEEILTDKRAVTWNQLKGV